MASIFDAFDESDARVDTLLAEVTLLRGSDAALRAELVVRWSATPYWLADVEQAISRATEAAADPSGEALATWQILLDEVQRARIVGEVPNVAFSVIAAALRATRLDVAEDVAARLLEAIRAETGATSEGTLKATLDLASIRMSRGIFSEAGLVAVLEADASTALRARALADLGVVRLVEQRYGEAFSSWREAHASSELYRGVDFGTVPVDRRAALVHAIRTNIRMCAFRSDDVGGISAWGLGGPRMIVPLFGLAALLHGDEARLVRAEAEARLSAGLAAWGVIDEETGATTEDLVIEIVDLLEHEGFGAAAEQVREAAGVARPG